MKLVKPTLVVTLIFIGAAALGALSDILLAATYGAGRIIDALVTALFIPLLLQEFILGDSFTRVFIPVFTGFLVRGEHEEGARVASSVINVLVLIFSGLVLLAILATPLLVAVIVPGFNPADQALTAMLTRIVMPVVVFTVLVSLLSSLLNAYQRFILPALAQIVYQVLLILAIVTLGRWYGVVGLAAGVVLTGVGQVLFLLPQVRQTGFRYHPVLDLRHPAVGHAFAGPPDHCPGVSGGRAHDRLRPSRREHRGYELRPQAVSASPHHICRRAQPGPVPYALTAGRLRAGRPAREDAGARAARLAPGHGAGDDPVDRLEPAGGERGV
ncbi:MAG: hypothetical protein C4309_04520 [Chloroflexota bacterium]